MTFRTRFAPSPTGPLHLGHAYSALIAYEMARAADGVFLLRIDDIDQSRARPEWTAQIIEDLTWFGLSWDGPIWRQSDHLADYRAAIETLSAQGLTYPCRCSRRDIAAAASAPQEGAPMFGPDGRIYPGTCRARPMADLRPGDAIRLNLAAALAAHPEPPAFAETGPAHEGRHHLIPDNLVAAIGDPVLARPQMGASYHLSVVVDDALQGITHVIRGDDLFEASFLQAALAHILGLPGKVFHHHKLIRDDQGKRLAKRDDARALRTDRAAGLTPADIRAKLGL